MLYKKQSKFDHNLFSESLRPPSKIEEELLKALIVDIIKALPMNVLKCMFKFKAFGCGVTHATALNKPEKELNSYLTEIGVIQLECEFEVPDNIIVSEPDYPVIDYKKPKNC